MYNDQEHIIGEFFDGCARNGLMTSFSPEDFERLNTFFKEWNIKTGERIFEPGCGSGRLTELIAQRAGSSGVVYACDLSCAMLSLAGARTLPEQVTLYRGSVIDVPVEKNFFDKVILFQVFPHFNDKLCALREIHRILKQHGDIWINHLKSREEINTLHGTASAVVNSHQIPDEDELRILFESSGFIMDGVRDSPNGYSAHAWKQ
jgi:ubiquinone/menaquinone biosynthesis C-methylase UbiE